MILPFTKCLLWVDRCFEVYLDGQESLFCWRRTLTLDGFDSCEHIFKRNMLKWFVGSCGQCILLEQLAVVRQFGYNCSVFFRCDENMWHPYVHSALRAVCALGVTLVVVNRPAVNYTDVLLNRLSAPVKWKPEILKGHENISVWMIHRVNCFKPFPGQNPSYLTYFIHYSHSFEWCNKTEIAFCEWHMDSLWLSIK